MESIEQRLRASVNYDAHNGSPFERQVCERQALEAAEEIIKLRDDNKNLRRIVHSMNDRVFKLVMRKEPFIVISMREPYFPEAYSLIRDQEILNDTWTHEDTKMRVKALEAHKEYIKNMEIGNE